MHPPDGFQPPLMPTLLRQAKLGSMPTACSARSSAPGLGDARNHLVVVRRHRIGTDIDGEDLTEQGQSLDDRVFGQGSMISLEIRVVAVWASARPLIVAPDLKIIAVCPRIMPLKVVPA